MIRSMTGGAFLAILALCPPSAFAETTCHGSGEYRVCTTVTQRPDGSMSVQSRDSLGNTYRLDTEIDTAPNGDMTVRSHDSLGNAYELESWTDSTGAHSRDSLGNRCTVTRYGTTIGC